MEFLHRVLDRGCVEKTFFDLAAAAKAPHGAADFVHEIVFQNASGREVCAELIV